MRESKYGDSGAECGLSRLSTEAPSDAPVALTLADIVDAGEAAILPEMLSEEDNEKECSGLPPVRDESNSAASASNRTRFGGRCSAADESTEESSDCESYADTTPIRRLLCLCCSTGGHASPADGLLVEAAARASRVASGSTLICGECSLFESSSSSEEVLSMTKACERWKRCERTRPSSETTRRERGKRSGDRLRTSVEGGPPGLQRSIEALRKGEGTGELPRVIGRSSSADDRSDDSLDSANGCLASGWSSASYARADERTK